MQYYSWLFVCAVAALTLNTVINGGMPWPKCKKARHVKRRMESVDEQLSLLGRLQNSVEHLTNRLANLVSPSLPEGGFMLSPEQHAAEYQAAIDWCWAGNFSDTHSEVLAANPDLQEFLHESTLNGYTERRLYDDVTASRRNARLNFVGGVIARNRNKNYLPKHQLLLALQSKHKLMHRQLWNDFASVRTMPAYNWTDDLVTAALKQTRPLQYPIFDGITAACFDNYSSQMNYHAAHNADTQGQRIDMTNWATLYLPLSSSPDFTLLSMGPNPLASMFKPGFDKLSIAELCHPQHPDITARQQRRWKDSFTTIANGTYFNRPTFQPWCANDMYYHDPIEGKLQSSYADVDFELNEMWDDDKHKWSTFVFLGGDGLAIHRINHTIARNPGKYLRTAPAVIPVQGEHPHGTCHVLHMGWRPYAPLLLTILHQTGHTECKADFSVSAFNDYDHVTTILIEGISKYFIHLSQSGGVPPLHNKTAVLNACNNNIDLACGWRITWLTTVSYIGTCGKLFGAIGVTLLI